MLEKKTHKKGISKSGVGAEREKVSKREKLGERGI